MGLDVCGCFYDVVAAVERIDADVLAMQECWRPGPGEGFAAQAAQKLGYHLYEGPFVGGDHFGTWHRVYAPDQTVATFGVTVLSRFRAENAGLVSLGKSIGDMHRAVLAVDLDVDGSPFRFCATHLTMRPHGSLREMLRLRRFRELLAGCDAPAVIAGDFNMWGPMVEWLTGIDRGAFGKTWPAQRPHSQIDHLLIDGPIQTVESRVLEPQGSDHRPLRAVFRIP